MSPVSYKSLYMSCYYRNDKELFKESQHNTFRPIRTQCHCGVIISISCTILHVVHCGRIRSSSRPFLLTVHSNRWLDHARMGSKPCTWTSFHQHSGLVQMQCSVNLHYKKNQAYFYISITVPATIDVHIFISQTVHQIQANIFGIMVLLVSVICEASNPVKA